MNFAGILLVLVVMLSLSPQSRGAEEKSAGRKRFLVVDSYHKGYNWSEDTNKGFTEAMLNFGYFVDREQVNAFNRDDYVETSTTVVKRMWMDTKRKKSKREIIDITARLTESAKAYDPDLIFLGDDNAARYIGPQFLDTDVPVVFWGVNNSPVKYGLIDSEERPGHNVTGVYQSGYYADGLRLLKTLVPHAKTFAVVADESPTGRSMIKAMQHLSRKGALPLELADSVSTGNFLEWKERITELTNRVDAFFIAQYNALKDENGEYVPNADVARWYLNNVPIPEAAVAGQFVRQGMLCTADDAGYNQGFDAVVMAHNILANGADPSTYPPMAPKRGPLTVNIQRADMLGLSLTDRMGIEKYVEKASALK